MEQWNDPSHGAMVVAMCMLASRYSSDPRVYGAGGMLALTQSVLADWQLAQKQLAITGTRCSSSFLGQSTEAI